MLVLKGEQGSLGCNLLGKYSPLQSPGWQPQILVLGWVALCSFDIPLVLPL